MVVETAYHYTNEDGDTFGNTVTASTSGVELRYDISVDGQAKALADVFQTVANCNGHGIGVFYWEPEVYGGWKPAEYEPLGWGSYPMGAFSEGRPMQALKTLFE